MSLKHFNSQTLRARELKFLKKVHHPPLSSDTCHMSRVICHMYFFFFSSSLVKVVKLVGGRSVINVATP